MTTDSLSHGFTVDEIAKEIEDAITLAHGRPCAERALRELAGLLAGTIDQRGSEPYGWAEPLRTIQNA